MTASMAPAGRGAWQSWADEGRAGWWEDVTYIPSPQQWVGLQEIDRQKGQVGGNGIVGPGSPAAALVSVWAAGKARPTSEKPSRKWVPPAAARGREGPRLGVLRGAQPPEPLLFGTVFLLTFIGRFGRRVTRTETLRTQGVIPAFSVMS